MIRGVNYMNKKLKTLLSLGIVSAFTASTMLPVNALCKNTHNKCTTLTTSKLYIIINYNTLEIMRFLVVLYKV